ncbi:unnamed protein product [Sphagnum jensenii]|uniref:TF-B3 domain-containing protein n=1 Tax=Sphagnum jensenii TaxID=128206 RepID=A0ABP1BE84_9BRYO
MVRRPSGGTIYTVPTTMVDSSKKAASAVEKGRISNLMDSVMTASGGKTRISVLMDAVMKASEEADAADFSEGCISHESNAKNFERPKSCEDEVLAEGRSGEATRRARASLQQKFKVWESQEQEETLSVSPPTFTKTVLAGSLAASHGSGIWIPLEFMKDHGHHIGKEAVLQDEYGMKWEVSVSRGSWSGFRAGWKKFADNHAMDVGDKIEFTLIGDSTFAVRILGQRQPVLDPRHCEDSHETEHKGISRKRSARHISSKSRNWTSDVNFVEGEAEVTHHQFHAGTGLGMISNPCKRARSKRFWNHKRRDSSGDTPQPEIRNPRLLQDKFDTRLEYPSTRSKVRQVKSDLTRQDNKALMYNSSAANKLRALVEIFEEEYQRTNIDVVYSQWSSAPKVGMKGR